MFEYNGSEFYTQNDRDMAEIADLKAKVAQLEAENGRIAELERENETNRKDMVKWFDKYISVKEFIQESIDNGEWSEDDLAEPFWERLAERLDIDIKLERDITVTVTWNLRVKTSKQSLSDWDFDISIDSDSGELEIISGESYPDIDISE